MTARALSGLMALVFFAGCDSGGRPPPEDQGPGPPPAVPVVPDPERAIGTVVARESVDVPARIEGVVASVAVGIGDRVEPGHPIAVIDDRPIREQLAMARSNARAASAGLARASADLAEAERRYERRVAMASQIAGEELENARYSADRARAAREQAAAAAAEIRSRVQQLERMLEETTVAAPFAGTVSIRYVDPGALVARGGPVVRLIASDELWVRFAIPAEQRGAYAVGAPVGVILEPDERELDAVVRRIAPDLDPVTQMVLGEAELRLDAQAGPAVQAGAAVWVRSRAEPLP